jgi:hypothetical protein
LGLQALDKIFDSNETVEGLTEEEKKLMQAYLKEQQEGGGKWKKKAGGGVAHTATAASNRYYTGFPGWNYYQQPMPPTQSSSTVRSGSWEQLTTWETDRISSTQGGKEGEVSMRQLKTIWTLEVSADVSELQQTPRDEAVSSRSLQSQTGWSLGGSWGSGDGVGSGTIHRYTAGHNSHGLYWKVGIGLFRINMGNLRPDSGTM